MKKAASIFLCANMTQRDVRLLLQWMENPAVTQYLNEDSTVTTHLRQMECSVPEPMLTYHFNRRSRFFMACTREGEAIGFVKLREQMTGTYEHSIDAKGRLFIPAKLREELGVTFYLAMGVDACLAIYPQATWDRFTEKFASLPMSQSKAMRPLFANAAKCELDSQGRIVIPQKLRKYAGLEKDVVIIGVNDRAEIWSADAWNAQEEEEMTPEKMAACMAELGF